MSGIILLTDWNVCDSEEFSPIESAKVNSAEWATEQSKGITLSRVIYLLKVAIILKTTVYIMRI